MKTKPTFISGKKRRESEFFMENDCLESRAIVNKDFCHQYIKFCSGLQCYGGRGLLISDIIFRERVGKFVTWV